MPPSHDRPGRSQRTGHRDREVRVAIRAQVQPGVAHLEPVGLARDGSVAAQQRHDRLQRLVHATPLGGRVDAQHVGVRHQRAGSAAQHGPAARHVVELDETLRHQERVVVWQAGHAGAEADMPGPLRRRGDHQLGRGDDLPAGRVMLPNPGLVVAQAVEQLDHLDVAGDGQGRVVAPAVERGEEDAELHATSGHRGVLRVSAAMLAQTTRQAKTAA